MKTMFKSVAVLMVAMITAQVAQAQNIVVPLQDQEVINVSAKILKQIVLTKEEDVAFGAVAAGTVPYFNPIDGGTSANVPSPTKKLGIMTVDATFDEILGISFPLTVTLTRSGGTEEIAYVPQMAVVTGDVVVNTGAVELGNSTSIPASPAITATANVLGMGVATVGAPAGYIMNRLNGTAEISTLFLGGWLMDAAIASATPPVAGVPPTDVIPSTLPSGNYLGNMTIQVNYYI
jgi:hypothetical protein